MQRQTSHIFMPGFATQRHAATRRGFTIIEIIFGILIIGVIMGLLIVSIRSARRIAQRSVDLNALQEVGKAIETFQNQFNFALPLVAEQRDLNADNMGGWNSVVSLTQPRNAITVINRSNPVDLAFLRGEGSRSTDRLTPFGLNSNQVGANDGANPADGFDQRFSTLSLGYFLAGALDTPYGQGLTGVPIDGISGPGFFKPESNGTFEVPESVRRATQADRKDVGTRFDSLVGVSGALKLYVETSNSDGRRVELRDRNGVAVRYYLWINEHLDNGTWRAPQNFTEMRIPRLIGRYVDETGLLNPPSSVQGESVVPSERDIAKNPGLRGRYMWALVAAGPNGVFGDETDAAIATGLGVTLDPGQALKRRFDAERDNLVVYGEVKR